MRILILAGPSGAGKTTWAQTQLPGAVRFSATDFFVDANGRYTFDAAGLGAAHAQCLRGFTEALQRGAHDHLVVDNTNTTLVELAPYIALAGAYDADIAVHIWCTAHHDGAYSRSKRGRLWHEVLAARSVHACPAGKCLQHLKLANELAHTWPKFWPRPTIHRLEE